MEYFIKKIADIHNSTGTCTSSPTTLLPIHRLDCLKEYSKDEVKKRLKPKSYSIDPIPTFILHEFLDDLLPFITGMCNKSLSEGHLPSSQCHALITPIIKKAGQSHSDFQNYRPISNLTFISKLVERMVSHQLVTFPNSNKLFPKLQSWFRARHSTETATLKVFSDILAAANQGKVTLLGLLDMSAAFDTVDHTILLERLEVSFRLFRIVLSWLSSFLTGRTQQVMINGLLSEVATVTSEVPQSSVLDPPFFLLYTADVPLIAAQYHLGTHWYADDNQMYNSTTAESSKESRTECSPILLK